MHQINITNALHEKILSLVAEERRVTVNIIEHLQDIYNDKLYVRWGFSNLFDYMTRALGYSESCAYRRVNAVKLANQIPEIKEHLKTGDLTLTNLAMAQSLFTSEKLDNDTKKEILERLKNKSKRQAEKIVAEYERPRKRREKLKMLPENKALLETTISQETIKNMDEIKALRSHTNPTLSYGEVIDLISYVALQKLRSTATRSKHMRSASRYIPVALEIAVYQRDVNKCTFPNCTSNHFLQIDHIVPISKGGQTILENLRLLCHTHHQFVDAKVG